MPYRYTKNIGVMILSIFPVCTVASGAMLSVASTWDPYLAGLPSGTKASAKSDGTLFDVAPDQSPTAVPVPLSSGNVLMFSTTGTVAHGPISASSGPEGLTAEVVAHVQSNENGFSNLTAPYSALVGVFLSDSQPNLTTAPPSLNFSTATARDYTSISPQLKQIFFIGDGQTSDGILQQIVVPAGATRFFLTTWDDYQWGNNLGTFNVSVVPESRLAVMPIALAVVLLARGRQHRLGEMYPS